MKIYADEPCPKHGKIAFIINADTFCKDCFRDLDPVIRNNLFRFWAILIVENGERIRKNKEKGEKKSA
jgi:hypothetical protein